MNRIYFIFIMMGYFFSSLWSSEIVSIIKNSEDFNNFRNIQKRFTSLTQIYKNTGNGSPINPNADYSSFGNKMYKNAEEASKTKSAVDFFSTYFKNISLTFKSNKSKNSNENVWRHFCDKVPVYYGTPATYFYYEQQYKEYMEKCIHGWKKLKSKQESLPPVAYVGATLNRFSQEAKPIGGSSFGVVFCNGANFESKKTDLFTYFNNLSDMDQRKKNLQDYLDEIFEVSFTSAINLAKASKQKKLYLIIPQIGMGYYAEKFQLLEIGNKTNDLFSFYLNAIRGAMEKSDFNDFEEVIFCLSNYGGQPYVQTAYTEFQSLYQQEWKQKNVKEKFKFNFLGEKESFFSLHSLSSEQREKDTFYCILFAADEKAFLNNGVFCDGSMEKNLAGVGNENFLGLPWLLNLFWPILLNSIKLEEKNIGEETLLKKPSEEEIINKES